MPQIPPEYNQLAHDFAIWAANIDVRQRATEALLRDKLITEQEWESALAQARAVSGVPVLAESTTETLAGFLKTITKGT